ncbi:thioredoxin family protein [Gracilibacillus oryzae]|uniref:Thioredoxin family protein n=1 Tax=Gracilibacillus oryzae TaxID=1672701 RepID=A0A7C8KPI7_9BACI|nr:thioredoxin family protein [Gracilibacillus oryzae]KAB8131778.1 thioredoxin family protein [Gracilibacillus oryzae]
MEELKEKTWNILNGEKAIIFIYTPFCATCQLAEKMIHIIEQENQSRVIYQMNASFYPDFMADNKIESVPALVFWDGARVQDKIYAMESVTKLFNIIGEWEQKWSISQ